MATGFHRSILIRTLILAALSVLFLAEAASAEDMTLVSTDQRITLSGEFLGYDGDFYRIKTAHGVLTVAESDFSCTGPGCPDLDSYVPQVTFSGTQRIADILLPALVQAYAGRNGLRAEQENGSMIILSDADVVKARFKISPTSTAKGYADLIAGKADIAMVLREPNSKERDSARKSQVGDLTRGRRVNVIALDGLVAVTSSGQQVKDIALQQFENVFTERSPNWSDLGGAPGSIDRHIPLPSTGVIEAFEDLFAKAKTPRGQAHATLDGLAYTVAGDNAAIGLTTLTEIGNTRPLNLADGCGFEIEPTEANLRSEDYPLTLPLMLYTPPRRLPKIARDFLAFASSSAADLVVRRAGFVDQSITMSDFNSQGDRLAYAITQAGGEVSLSQLQRLVNVLRPRNRLSTTFRFNDGSKELDVQSQENVARMAQALVAGRFDGQELTFAGFSDGVGNSVENLKLSAARASEVMAAIQDKARGANFGRLTLRVEAFGEALPMACESTEQGRAINRRVEVWIR